jgi:uncharacterized membrane protein YcaP (DUF421 family)
MLVDKWMDLVRVVAVGVPIYFVLVALLRVTGKRALAKMSAFDLVVTVALGSVLATTFLSDQVKLVEGLLALALLLGLQYLVAWAGLKWPKFRSLVVERPRLLLYQGRMLPDALRKERIAHEEVLAAVRSSGHMSLADVEAVVLETDGGFSVMGRQSGDASAMESVSNFPPPAKG